MGKVIKIRKGVFETNSSSTHSITMCNESDYNKWINGDLYLARWGYKGKDFISREEYNADLKEYIDDYHKSYPDEVYEDSELEEDFRSDNGYISYKEWCDDFDYETEKSEFVSEHGDKVIALCYYGNDY